MNITFEFGEKKFEPPKYHIVVKSVSHWWFFTKTEYSIESDFGSLGGFISIPDCMEALTNMRVGFMDIVIDV